LCPLQKGRNREVTGDLPVDLVAGADLDLVQVAQHVHGGKGHLGGTLHPAAITGGYRVKPAYPAGTPGSGAILASIAAPAAQLLRLIPKKLRYKGAGAHSAGVGFGDGHNALDVLR